LHNFNNIHLVHYSNDLVEIVSKQIAESSKELLPDLRDVVVFLPNQLSQNLVRRCILKEIVKLGHDAVFPPLLTTLRQWVRKQHKVSKPVLSQYARELILVDAIKQQPDLFSKANPWGIANELLSLFDAMLLNDIRPIEFNHYYQGENKEISHALLHESDLIKVLWEAWIQQITEEDYLDPIQRYSDALKTIDTTDKNIYFCVGLDQLSKLEVDFLNKVDEQSTMFFYAYASNECYSSRTDSWLKKYLHPDAQITYHQDNNKSAYSELFDSTYINSTNSLKQKAEIFGNTFPESIKDRLNLYKSNDFEQHTKAIDVQIRIWINENKQNIGIVTTDRKLVRRLRAVLEHANIAVNDAAGWSLATTSAAVIVEWWLQLVEERYPAKQLLALANSPFYTVDNVDLHDAAINYLEKEIILKHNLHSGIHHFRNELEKEQNKSIESDEEIFTYLNDLLDKFESSAQLLAKLHSNKTYPLHKFLTELLNSLKPIGIYTSLNRDNAGKQIIDLFEDQISHFRIVDNNMNWSESRRFMSRILDQQNFKPPTAITRVTFYSLEQSRLQHFDGLIIASVDKNNFPGSINNYVFFNEQVRSELKIPTWRDDHARHFHQFRSLLEASENILITVQTEQKGEKTTPSPWLESIETFYRIAYKDDLLDKHLKNIVEQTPSTVISNSEIAQPKQYSQPEPVVIPALKPNDISISQYQSLVNCPYQYFALSCLKLSQTEELQEELGKADFGSLVHHCIHAFFSKQPHLPGPFANKVTVHNRKDAEEMLRNISEQVFAHSSTSLLEDDFNNSLWLQRWLNLIPKFISWEIKHGRLDRVDKSDNGFSIIDYKTGLSPTKKSIIAGEQVQLPMYAVLNDHSPDNKTTQVEYVAIGDNNTVKSLAVIKDVELEELKSEHLSRLKSFFDSLNKDTPFTALATDDTCERCSAIGICRKGFW